MSNFQKLKVQSRFPLNEGFNARENHFFHSFKAVQALLHPPSVTPGLSLCQFPLLMNNADLARQTTSLLSN
jgi:hypothetical protein